MTDDVDVEELEGALWRLVTSLGGSPTIDEVAGSLALEGGPVTGGTFADLALLPSGADTVTVVERPVLGRGPEVRHVALAEAVPACEAVRTGLPVLLGSRPEIGRRFPGVLDDIVAAGFSAWAAVPLHGTSGDVLGSVDIGWALPQRFEAGQLRRLDLVAQLVAMTVERAQAVASERGTGRRGDGPARRPASADSGAGSQPSRLPTEVAERLVGSADRTEVLQRLSRLLVPRMADWCTVIVPEGEALVRVAARHVDPAREALAQRLVGSYPHPFSGPSPGVVVYRTGAPLRLAHLVEDINRNLDDSTASNAYGRTLRLLGDGPGLITPVAVDGEVQAVVTLTRRAGDGYSDEDVAVMADVASQVAVALVSADQVLHQHQTARALQAAVLPTTLPSRDGITMAARYRPASHGGQVGGDWYDAFELVDGRIALVIGDVAGHGIGAAALTAQMRNVLRANLFSGVGPLESLCSLSHLIAAQEPDAMATIACAELDPSTGAVTWASAGHPAPIIVSSSGHAEYLTGLPVPPVGCIPAALAGDRREHRARLDPGSRLVLFTDGLYERRNVDLDIGLAHLMILAEQSIGLPDPGAVCDVILDGVLTGADEDDACLLVAQRDPSPRHWREGSGMGAAPSPAGSGPG